VSHNVTQRKKLIEVALPLEAINRASAREKSIRHGHPSTLQLWWARRPLAAARAVDGGRPVILALVEFASETERRVRYVRSPFQREPDFGVTSVNYDFAELLASGEEPS